MMRLKFGEFVFCAFFFVFGLTLAEDIAIDQILSLCCNTGDEWGSQRKNCSAYTHRLELVPVELHGLCLSAVDICCTKQQRIYHCTAGEIAAKNGLNCKEHNDDYGSEYFKDCCEACKIGLVVGSSSNICSLEPFTFGNPWDDVYKNCCNEMKADDSFILTEDEEKNLCNRFDSLCTQICENTDNSYVCKCHEGFYLLEDKRTCDLISRNTNFQDNEVFPNETSGFCPRGYLKNELLNKCEDIDECETGEAECDAETQACLNSDGSYRCIDITESSSKCNDGYRFNVKNERCEDMNECLEELDNCDRETQHCLNTRGSFNCQNKVTEKCLLGLAFDPILKQCQDIDECVDPGACDTGFKCINVIGSYECIAVSHQHKNKTHKLKDCAPGYRRHLTQCVDIDECAIDKNSCDSNQVCTNENGGFRCDCKIGFILDQVTNACVDINECQINNHECLESQRCDNTIGSYTCIRLQSCGTGYTLNAGTGICDDDDECILNRHNCAPGFQCHNTKGSFRCVRGRPTPPPTTPRTTTLTPRTSAAITPSSTMRDYYIPPRTTVLPPYEHKRYQPPNIYETQPEYRTNQVDLNRIAEYNRNFGPCSPGFERNYLGACVDVNECERIPDICRRNQKCINSNGSYRCHALLQCSGGYMSNPEGTKCIDIDECQTSEANCGPEQTCKNKPGGYICVCPPGHKIGLNSRCEDINECEMSNNLVCSANAMCINSVGSYYCDCKEGFKKQRDEDRVCIDVNECNEQPGLCHQKCVNFWGSYRCACNSGFKLNANNRTCDDIDECEINKSYNLCVGFCENTPGSYACACPPGYRLGADGRSCQDIDECDYHCKGRHEICTNTRGSYRCITLNCPHDYVIDPDRVNRCKRITNECDVNDDLCFQRPSSYSYNFITFVSNMSLPPQGRALFNLKGPSNYDNIDFDLRIVNVEADSHIQRANQHHFSITKSYNEALLNVIRPLEGPQDIELEMSMNVYSNSYLSGTNIAKIFIYVSEYTF